MSDVVAVELDACDSTQDEVFARLAGAAAGTVVAVRSRSQRAGRGRDGRAWQDPPGDALLVSVGMRGPVAIDVLDRLPQRLGAALVRVLGAPGLAWKAPNDIVASTGGAKVAGILVDARTLDGRVEHVVVGVGCNLDGPPFATVDGRGATSLAALGVDAGTVAATPGRVVAAIVAELRGERVSRA